MSRRIVIAPIGFPCDARRVWVAAVLTGTLTYPLASLSICQGRGVPL